MLFGGGGFREVHAHATGRRSEFITIAGPLVNRALRVIAVLILPLLPDTALEPVNVNGTMIEPPLVRSQLHRIVEQFAQLNLFLALFNLIPVLPLDGGRLLNSWLHRFVRGIPPDKITGGVGVALLILWIPLMFAAFFTFGVVLLFFPKLMLHRRMLRQGHG